MTSPSASAGSEAHRRFRGPVWEKRTLSFVLLVWLACAVAAHAYIARYAPRMPITDDTAIFQVLFDEGGPSLPAWLWSLHNEHRVPFPKLVQLALYRLTGDIRSGMHVQAAMYALTALACIVVARRLRGGSRPWDAFFPLALLQLGNSENLLMGFQLCVAIPVACVCAILILSVLASPPTLASGEHTLGSLRPLHACASALALLILPLCGAVGLLHVPLLGAWMAWLGWRHQRSADRNERTASWIYLCASLASSTACAWYAVGFERPSHLQYDRGGWSVVVSFFAFSSAAFGPASADCWPASAWLLALVMAGFALVLLRRLWNSRGRDERALGACMVLAACASLALGIAFGRPAGPQVMIPNRYIPLAIPFFITAALSSLALVRSPMREAPLTACCVAMAAAMPSSLRYAEAYGQSRRDAAREVSVLVNTHAGSGAIAEAYQKHFLFWLPVEDSRRMLALWAKHELPPFDEVPGSAAAFLTR